MRTNERQIIVQMHAIKGGVRRMNFVQVSEVFVNKVGKRFS